MVPYYIFKICELMRILMFSYIYTWRDVFLTNSNFVSNSSYLFSYATAAVRFCEFRDQILRNR